MTGGASADFSDYLYDMLRRNNHMLIMTIRKSDWCLWF